MTLAEPNRPQDRKALPVLVAAPHRIAKVALTVHDLDRVGNFYKSVIGLGERGRETGVLLLGTSDATLIELRHNPAARLRSPSEPGLFHTAFLLPERADLGAWLDLAMNERIPIQGASDHHVSEAVYLADPEGNGVEMYVDRPSSEWSWDGGAVHMTTDPLDMQDLKRSAEGRIWAGYPHRGTIGHIHLQVGALPPAETFYRDRLGFELTNRYPGAYFFGSGGYHHQLAVNVWNSRGASPRTDLATGLANIEIDVAESTLAHVRASAADRLVSDAQGRLTIRDPWNTPITLVPSLMEKSVEPCVA